MKYPEWAKWCAENRGRTEAFHSTTARAWEKGASRPPITKIADYAQKMGVAESELMGAGAYGHASISELIAHRNGIDKWAKDQAEEAGRYIRVMSRAISDTPIIHWARIRRRPTYDGTGNKLTRHQARVQNPGYKQYHNFKAKAYQYKRRSKGAQCTDAMTSAQWYLRMKEFGYRCAYCGKTRKAARSEGHELEADHIVPISVGNPASINRVDNIIPACKQCNTSKSNRLPSDWSGYRRGHSVSVDIAIDYAMSVHMLTNGSYRPHPGPSGLSPDNTYNISYRNSQ